MRGGGGATTEEEEVLGILRVPRMEGEGEGEVSLISSHSVSLISPILTKLHIYFLPFRERRRGKTTR